MNQRVLDESAYRDCFKHILARVANVDGAYLRFSGTVSVERYVGAEEVEKASDPGIWELMYLGHVE